jgi:hypothetical protein
VYSGSSGAVGRAAADPKKAGGHYTHRPRNATPPHAAESGERMKCGHCNREVTAKDLRWKPARYETAKGHHTLVFLEGKRVLVCLVGLVRW